MTTGSQLRAVDLDAAEREALANGIAKLAMEREKKDEFEAFVQWLEEHGPVELFVDGANVGMLNQSFHQGEFNFQQVRGGGNC